VFQYLFKLIDPVAEVVVPNSYDLIDKIALITLTAYSAASAGVIAFTKALSREVAGHNIFVNCVAPGPIDTDMIQDLGPDAVASMSELNQGSNREMVERIAE